MSTQYITQKFKHTLTKSGITLTLSTQYHYQANILSQKAVVKSTSLGNKSVEVSKFLDTEVFMYSVTPLYNKMP